MPKNAPIPAWTRKLSPSALDPGSALLVPVKGALRRAALKKLGLSATASDQRAIAKLRLWFDQGIWVSEGSWIEPTAIDVQTESRTSCGEEVRRVSETPSDGHSLVRGRRNAGTTKSACTNVLAVTLVHNTSSRSATRPVTMPPHDAHTSAIIQSQEAPKRD